MQSLTDSTVLTCHDCWPQTYMHEAPEAAFMQQWYDNMTVALKPAMALEEPRGQPRRGVFAASCYTHTSFTHSYPLVAGLNFYQALVTFTSTAPVRRCTSSRTTAA